MEGGKEGAQEARKEKNAEFFSLVLKQHRNEAILQTGSKVKENVGVVVLGVAAMKVQ